MSDTNHLDGKVREVFHHLGIETNISFSERIGKPRRAPISEQPSPQRPRTALVTVSTSWDAKRILERAHLLKDFEIKGLYLRRPHQARKRNRKRTPKEKKRTD